jgi:small nuclear ribonucleoprotein (snRNP)-like protein
MQIQVLENFLNQQVEVTVANKTFSGILRMSESCANAIELDPTDDHVTRRYGAVTIMADQIVTIRAMKPRQVEKDMDIDSEDWDDVKCASSDFKTTGSDVKMPADLQDYVKDKV